MSAAAQGVLGPRRRGLTLGIAGVVTAVAFEAMAVATAMPVAVSDLGGLGAYGWAFSGFLVASLFATVVAGETCDSRGPRIPLVGGMAVFTVGLVVAGTAVSMPGFVLGRMLQGLGAGGVVVAVYVVVGSAYPEDVRPRMFSVLSAAWILPALVGPSIAGVLTEHLSWRLVFLLVPFLGVPATLLILPRLAHLEPPGRGRRRAGRTRLALAVAAGAAALQVAGTRVDAWSVPLLVTGVALLLLALPRLLPGGALRLRRGLPTTVLMRGGLSGPFFGAGTFVPLLLVTQRGLTPTVAGVTLTVGSLGWSTGAWIQGRPTMLLPREALVRSGAILLVAGILAVATTLRGGVPVLVASVGWVLAGLGMGLGMASVSVASLRLAAPGDRGFVSAGMQLCDTLAATLTIALGSAIYAVGRDSYPTTTFALILCSMAVLAAVTALVAGRMRPPTAVVAEEPLVRARYRLRP
ncbi:MAG TPA: MFS transporter [Actinomycetes bacterium]|nr:MFS transporter [Actinomycetes bacterium]